MSELFIELGTEELPARMVGPTLQGLAAAVQKLLGGLAPTAPRVWATPRRLAVAFSDVVLETPGVEKVVTGPAVAIAFKDGAPGPVAIAFAAKLGMPVEALERVAGPKGEIIAGRRVEGAQRLADVLASGLHGAIFGIPFKKQMKWGQRKELFPRPLRYVCVVLDGERVNGEVAGLPTVDTSVGHWLWFPEPFRVTSAAQWEAEMLARDVVPDMADRRRRLVDGLVAKALELGADLSQDDALVDEVTNLVEIPTVIVGQFDRELLNLPPRLLIESMKVNQRYFPLTVNGELTNQFLLATNNPRGDMALIAKGNGLVLAARFHDAKFFYAEDRKVPLVKHGEKLAGMVWLREVKGANGRALTMAERQVRVAAAGERLAALCGADTGVTLEAGMLTKSDLSTSMVGEFPELQGHVGRKLAEAEGLPAAVALAIEEHYLPRFTGDAIPTTPAGAALALAERLTLLDAAFAAGLQPKGGADHLGLRRAAVGVVALMLGNAGAGSVTVQALFIAAGCAGGDELAEFVLARLRGALSDEGIPTDVVEAVFSAGTRLLPDLAARARAFRGLTDDGRMGAIRATFRRVAGLVKQNPGEVVPLESLDGDALEPAGRALRDAVAAIPVSSIEVQLASLVAVRPQVDAFFDAVMVMADDPALRAARLGLLRAIVDRFSTLADFSKLSTV